MRDALRLGLAILGIAVAQPALAGGGHEHEGDMIVGRTSAGQLAIEFNFDEDVVLPPTSGFLNGWALDEPGIDPLEEDEPGEDFYTLSMQADVSMVVTSMSPGLKAWLPGFVDVLDGAGDAWHLGSGEDIHQHATWHIDRFDPGFDAGDSPWSLSFRLVDSGASGYADSEAYTMTFVPEPASLALLLPGLLAVGRRRGRA